MQPRRLILRGAMVGGLLALAGLVAPVATTQAAGGDYGTCCTIIVNPPSVTPPNVNPPSVTPPQIIQSVPVVPVGGGGSSSVSSSSSSMASISPVSASVSPVSIAARPVTAAAPPPPPPPAPAPPPVSQVLGRTVEAPEPSAPPAPPAAVVPRPIIEETAPRVVAPPEEIAETAPRTVQREVCIPGVGGAGLGPTCGEVLGRTVQGPGLVLARALPKAGEGLSAGFVVWPPLALGGAALALALVALVLPRRRPSARAA
jgi:hypothetical protein